VWQWSVGWMWLVGGSYSDGKLKEVWFASTVAVVVVGSLNPRPLHCTVGWPISTSPVECSTRANPVVRLARWLWHLLKLAEEAWKVEAEEVNCWANTRETLTHQVLKHIELVDRCSVWMLFLRGGCEETSGISRIPDPAAACRAISLLRYCTVQYMPWVVAEAWQTRV